jgi:orotate phosphoribosyltransferase
MLASYKAALVQAVRETALQYGRFTLKSGATSHFYLDLRRTHLSAGTLRLVVDGIRRELRDQDFDALGGPSLGADPLVGGFLVMESQRRPNLRGFLVRPWTKDHGIGGRVAGEIRSGDRCVVIEDVTTTGGSLLDAVEVVQALGATVTCALTVVDRSEGKAAHLFWGKVPFFSFLTLDDLGIDPPPEGWDGRSTPLSSVPAGE